jgi:hypothetical protein
MAKESMSGPALNLESVDLDRGHQHFAGFDTLPLLRGDEDWAFTKELGPEELALARRFLRANLRSHQLFRVSAALLNDREAIPLLHNLLAQAQA